PAQQVQIFQRHHFIKATPVNGKVLVFPKALKIKGLLINQKFSLSNLNRPHPERLLVSIQMLPVPPQLDHTGIQIGVSRLPEVHRFDGELTNSPATTGNDFIGFVLNGDVNLSISLKLDAVDDLGGRSLYLSGDGDITDIGGGGGIELDRALDARVVEKVKVGDIPLHAPSAWNVIFSIHARWQRGMIHNVVDRDRQAIFAGACKGIDLGLKRGKAPFVLG